MITRIRAWISGYKTYATAVIMVATAVVAWASGEIDGEALVLAIYASLQAIFIRAGVTKSTKDTEENLDVAVTDIIKDLQQ